jgi:predicted ATPase
MVYAEPSLLLLDNCEHVIEGVATVAVRLLRLAPQLTVIATSRRSLSIEGESVYEVVPLEVPPVGAGVDELWSTPSSRLFLDRAALASPGFAIDSDSSADIVTLCRRLDGIPLALELAASNLRSMTSGEIVESLQDRISLKGRQRTLPHHRTLRATLQWSYDLLNEEEQQLFDRLAVFSGRFSRGAALASGIGEPGPTASALAALVDASLLVADVSDRSTSYRMLPTMRDFGLFNLREEGELESVRRSHADYLTSDAAEMDLPLNPFGATRRIEQNVSVDDFRAAASWALRAEHDELALALLVPITFFCLNAGRLSEAEDWLSRIDLEGDALSLERWRLQMVAGCLDFQFGRTEAAEGRFRSLSVTGGQLGEAEAVAVAIQLAGRVRWRLGDLHGARDDMAAAVDAGSDWAGTGHTAREGLAVIELSLGNVEAAENHARFLDAFAERTKDPVTACTAVNTRGWVAWYQGDLEASVRCFERLRDLAIELGAETYETDAHRTAARVFLAAGMPQRALREAEAARDLATEAGTPDKHGDALVAAGGAHLDMGDVARAAQYVATALEVLRSRAVAVRTLLWGLQIAGWITLAGNRAELAARYLIAAEFERERMGQVDPPASSDRMQREMREARRVIGDDAWTMAEHSVRSSTFTAVVDEAIDYLRGVLP